MLSSLRDYMEPEAVSSDSDESLDLLVKHALRTHTPHVPTPNSDNVWTRLSSRVRGPFGRLAVEGPATSGDEMASFGSGNLPFSVGDEKTTQMPNRNSQETSDQHTGLYHHAKEAIQLT